MLSRSLWLLGLAAAASTAQSSSSETTAASATSTGSTQSSTSPSSTSNTFTFTNSGFSTIPASEIPTTSFTGSGYAYVTGTEQSTITTLTETISTNGTVETVTATSSVSMNSQITVSSSSASVTLIAGSSTYAPNATNATFTSTTSSAPLPSNTLPCNGFPQFCTRKYSNITMIAAHNAPFVVRNNAASNQALSIQTQLNDGVRMLTGETHYVNGSMWNCHTNCKLLNVGPWQNELETVRGWLNDNPYNVVTILITNSDFTTVENYVAPITNAGLLPYVYTPAYVPQHRDQWPTLGEMILKNQRVVFFMDYNANQTAVPYILDQYSHVWQTPFSPTNQSFPCTIGTPENLNTTVAREQYMYLANHNLNTAIDLAALGFGDETILIPNTAELATTNGQENQLGTLGATYLNCTADWGLPPNFLVVDYYNVGSPNAGSVFQVAAAANNVTDNRPCCGLVQSAASSISIAGSTGALVAAGLAFWMAW